jgi:hypothetical protein
MTRRSLADRAIAEAKALYSHETSTLVALDATGANASFIEWIVICEPAAAQWVVRGGWSFREALRSQPVYAAASRKPLVNFIFALEPFDVSRLGAGAFGDNLPIVRRDPLHLERDTRFLAHARNMPASPS